MAVGKACWQIEAAIVLVLGLMAVAPVMAKQGSTTPSKKHGSAVSARAGHKAYYGKRHHYSAKVRAMQKLGKRGGDLSPVSDAFSDSDDASFVPAIDAWNAHHWKEGVRKFRAHLKSHPHSPWAGEAELHIGCFYRYTDQYEKAVQQFQKVMQSYPGTDVADKAKKRLAGTYYLEGKYSKALELYRQLFSDKSASWRHRSYALHWLRHVDRIRAVKKGDQALNQCGLKSLALVYDQLGLTKRAKAVEALAAKSTQPASFGKLQGILRKDFPKASLVRTDIAGLLTQRFPVIAHVGSNHFLVVTGIDGDTVQIQDPYHGEQSQTVEQFAARWDGTLLSSRRQSDALDQVLSGVRVAGITGGCCGFPVPEPHLGANPDEPEEPPLQCPAKGSPKYAVNMVNLNLVVRDTPFYYTPGKGLPVEISMTFNSGDSAPPSYFGNKWSFNYDTHYILDPGTNVLIIRPDGRRDLFTRNTDNSFTPPEGVFDQLSDDGGDEYTLVLRHSKIKYHYNAAQNLAYIEDKWGNRLTFYYDANDNLDYMTDASGQVTDFTLDAQNRITQITGPFGRSVLITYYPEGNLHTTTDMGGYTSTYTYDVNTEPSGAPDGAPLSGTYDMTSLTTLRGTTTFKYIYPDDSGYVSYPPVFDTSGANYHIIVTDPDGRTTEYWWDGFWADSRVTRGIKEIHDTDHVDGFIEPDERRGGITTIYTAGQNIYEPDTFNKVIDIYREADKDYGAAATWPIGYPDDPLYIRVAHYDYPTAHPNDRVITNAVGKSMTIERDDHGNVTGITDFAQKKTVLTYDGSDNLTSIEDPEHRIKRYDYYPNGALKTVTLDRATETDIVTALTYKPYGKVETITNPMGKMTTLGYDSRGYLAAIISPSAHPETVTYDNKGRLWIVRDEHGTELAKYTYDNLDRWTRIDYPDSTFEKRTYFCCSIESYTDRAGHITTYDPDGMGRVAAIHHPDRGITKLNYDDAGRLYKITDPQDNPTTYTLNPLGWVLKETWADGSSNSYDYNALGDAITRTNRDATIANFTYDDDSRLKHIGYPEGDYVDYTYYDNGLLHTVANTNGTYTYSYDDVNRLESVVGPEAGDTQTYQYDLLSNVTRFSDPRYGTVQYDYDYVLNRLKKVTDPGSREFTFDYWPDSEKQLKTIAYPSTVTTGYAYDTQHRFSDIVTQTATAVVLDSRHYTYTDAQNIDTITHQDGQLNDYDYDPMDRLTSELITKGGTTLRSDAFVYDKVGNRINSTRDGASLTLYHNELNQLNGTTGSPQSGSKIINLTGTVTDKYSPVKHLTLEGAPVTLDANGNFSTPVTLTPGENVFHLQAEDALGNKTQVLTRHVYYGVDTTWEYDFNGSLVRKNDSASGVVEKYVENSRGQLQKYDRTGAAATTATYAYDPYGRRVEKTVDGVATKYIYDPAGNLIAETDGSGAVVRKYVWVAGMPIEQVDISGGTETATYLHDDHLGTPRVGTDSTEKAVWTWQSDAFGATAANDDPDGDGIKVTVNLRFPGQYYDAESGLHYNYHRNYDPNAGRYVSGDPIGLDGGLNTYAYVEDNPLELVDPAGLYPTCKTYNIGEPVTKSHTAWNFTEVSREHGFVFQHTGISVGPNLDPRVPRRPPVSVSMGEQVWWAVHVITKIEEYLVVETWQHQTTHCTEQYTDSCGKQRDFFYSKSGDVIKSSVRKLINTSYTNEVKRLFLIAVIPF